jgi:surfeit locus 1 family protein
MGPFSFAPRPVPTVAAVLMIVLTISLGRWQLHRAEEKEARQSLFDSHMAEAPLRLTGPVPSAEPLLFRRVHAQGEWLADRQIYIDNQIHEGRAGFAVVTPLRLRGTSAAVLVNRGWTPRGSEYPRAPRVDVPAGPATVDGLAVTPPARFLELSKDTVAGDVWQNLSIDRIRAASKLDLLPIVVLADPAAPGLKPFVERPDAGAARHREYELTWFALAATAFVLWLVLNVKRSR